VCYNASVVKIHSAMGSLLRFESTKNYSTLKNALAFAVNSEVVGLAPVFAIEGHLGSIPMFERSVLLIEVFVAS
jgi:hypothetical protein